MASNNIQLKKIKAQLKTVRKEIEAEKAKTKRILKKHESKMEYLNEKFEENKLEQIEVAKEIQELSKENEAGKERIRILKENVRLVPDAENQLKVLRQQINKARNKYIARVKYDLKENFEKNGGDLDWQLCQICCNNFSKPLHRPNVLPCGHTLCTSCICELKDFDTSTLTCPVDRNVIPFSVIRDLPENITISDYCW